MLSPKGAPAILCFPLLLFYSGAFVRCCVEGFGVAAPRPSYFATRRLRARKGVVLVPSPPSMSSSPTTTFSFREEREPNKEEKEVSISDYIVGVVAPLKYIGPYATLELRFPTLGNADGGRTFRFVLDTGANINSIDARLVDELGLSLVMSCSDKDIPIVGTGGTGRMKAGDIYLLGDCELVGLPQKFTFMTNLTAAALPYPSPVSEGLLGMAFLASIPAGVAFDWYGTFGDPPTVEFYTNLPLPDAVVNMTRVPLLPLAGGAGAGGVLTLTLNVNGTDVPALLDTGAPITILNRKAAAEAGIEIAPERQQCPSSEKTQQQAFGDDALQVAGVDGGRLSLYRSKSPVSIRSGNFSFGEDYVYVGDVPGLDLMGKLGGLLGDDTPAVVLGLSSLKRSYRMILRAADNEVWFEELRDQPKYTETIG